MRIGLIERYQGAHPLIELMLHRLARARLANASFIGRSPLSELIIHRLAHRLKAMGENRAVAGDERRLLIVGKPELELPVADGDRRRTRARRPPGERLS